jgi:hypothetical protein
MSPGSLEAVDRVVDEGGDADDVLRAVVAALAAEPDIAWAGIEFLEAGELVLGPSAGLPDETRRRVTTIAYRGELVGELVVDGLVEQSLLDHVAASISEYVLLGWDTGGHAWEP